MLVRANSSVAPAAKMLGIGRLGLSIFGRPTNTGGKTMNYRDKKTGRKAFDGRTAGPCNVAPGHLSHNSIVLDAVCERNRTIRELVTPCGAAGGRIVAEGDQRIFQRLAVLNKPRFRIPSGRGLQLARLEVIR